jgi:hypothetical protein
MNRKLYIVAFALLGGSMLILFSHKPRFDKEATKLMYSYLGDNSFTNEVAALLARGADPNFWPGWPTRGTTPLHVAGKCRAIEIAKVLVRGGATNGSKDAFGMTAFEAFVFSNPSNEEIVEWQKLLGVTNTPRRPMDIH